MEGAVVKEILDCYEAASGQAINFQKSALLVSLATSWDQKEDLKAIFQLGMVRRHSQYLGLPSTIGRNKKSIFGGIKEKVLKRLASWLEKLFLVGGKEILIKVVLQTNPTYPMSLFWLPVGLCKDLERCTARFWWGISKEKKMRLALEGMGRVD